MNSDDIRILGADYRLALEAENKSSQTVAVYGSAIQRFAEWLEANARPTVASRITRKDCQGFIEHLLTTRKPATAHNRFRELKTFFRWLEIEDEIPSCPGSSSYVGPRTPNHAGRSRALRPS
ncbi:MAG: phage integrase N-terminal SAM-like domain-containing protein [Actinobacteria bacterium]|nr:phage integrase N-terminal SAM-like domain-containing protein [Actinomycetota bacterium]